MQAVKQKRQSLPKYLEEAIKDKEALAYLLTEKALETENTKISQFYYVAASFLKLPVLDGANKILATDGEAFYAGQKYILVKEKYGTKIVPFLWLHEVLHVMHIHPDRMKLVDDPELYNIVADLYINEMLRNRLGDIPNDFVTLSSFINFILRTKGKHLTEEEKEALRKLADMVVQEKITVEEAYAVIDKIPSAKKEIKDAFKNSSFFGKDLPQQKACKGKPQKENTGGKKGGGQMEGSEGGAQTPQLPAPDEATKELEKTLKKIREKVDEALSEYRKALGELNALRSFIGAPPGTERGAFGEAEYNEMLRLRVKLEQIMLREIGRVVQEYEVNFSRFDRDAYWLPEDRELFKSKVKVFLDTSGSIPIRVVKLFMKWVNQAVKKYNITADVIVFGYGALAKYTIGEKIRKLERVPLGGGTVWDETIASELIKSIKEDVPLLVVLSDFMIDITPEASEAIAMYKKRGGKISCWSIYGFSDFCDYKHKFPKAFKALS